MIRKHNVPFGKPQRKYKTRWPCAANENPRRAIVNRHGMVTDWHRNCKFNSYLLFSPI